MTAIMTPPRERSQKSGWRWRWNRLRLRRSDGRIYLDRWGFEHPGYFGVFLHMIDAEDPGTDLHCHPWWFASCILKGGYRELRCDIRHYLHTNDRTDIDCYQFNDRKRWSWKTLGLHECHRIVSVPSKTWTLTIHGPDRRRWGFYTNRGWVLWSDHDGTDGRNELQAEISNVQG